MQLGQPGPYEFGLLPPDVGQRRVAVAIDELEVLSLDGVGRCTVTHEKQLRGSGRTAVRFLTESAGRRHAGRV